jgi:hypothetical protein
MSFRTTLAAAALISGTAAASANVVDLPGMYGNKAGCNWHYNADRDDDSLVALSVEGFERFATGCEFVSAAKALDGSQVATMLCSHEGETFRSIEFLLIVKAGEGDAYELYSESGEQIAVVDRCE